MSTGRKNIKVTSETETGRNEKFYDPTLEKSMTRIEFVDKIRNEYYTGYTVKNINGKQTPVSKPDDSEGNNLG
jgi:hypothetical protein